MADTRVSPIAFLAGADHDHRRCREDALAAAQAICVERGLRLTALRRRVLELVWASHSPIGAYDILARLRAERPQAAPPTVYRALDFLIAEGLVHRVAGRNAFIGCAEPGHAHAGQVLICRTCGAAAELHERNIGAAIARGAAKHGFTVTDLVVEAEGLCARCQEESAIDE